ncbi:MAG TPA: methyltransferase [Porphyromonadaceae bacterium]|nr:methyltransferase [Porphyromonadaceae bacterium]
MKTPITYWGGKQQLTKRILSLIPTHKQYDEPFFGGGAIFFAKQPSEIEFINDVNGEMVNFYRTLKRKFPELKDEVDCTLHSEFQHNQAREIYSDPLSHSDVLRSWAVWMLSKQSIYSIFTNGWAVSIDSNKAKQVQWSKETFTILYARRLERTSIFCRDAINVIESTDTPTTFHYVDPPYFNSDMGHYDGYTKEDFTNLLNVLSSCRGRFMLSSYPSDILNEYVKQNGWKCIEMNMKKSSGKGNKTEVLTINYHKPVARQMMLF